MNKLKIVVIYIVTFFGLFFTLSFLMSLITDNTFKACYTDMNGFLMYSVILGWWVALYIALPNEKLENLNLNLNLKLKTMKTVKIIKNLLLLSLITALSYTAEAQTTTNFSTNYYKVKIDYAKKPDKIINDVGKIYMKDDHILYMFGDIYDLRFKETTYLDGHYCIVYTLPDQPQDLIFMFKNVIQLYNKKSDDLITIYLTDNILSR